MQATPFQDATTTKKKNNSDITVLGDRGSIWTFTCHDCIQGLRITNNIPTCLFLFPATPLGCHGRRKITSKPLGMGPSGPWSQTSFYLAVGRWSCWSWDTSWQSDPSVLPYCSFLLEAHWARTSQNHVGRRSGESRALRLAHGFRELSASWSLGPPILFRAIAASSSVRSGGTPWPSNKSRNAQMSEASPPLPSLLGPFAKKGCYNKFFWGIQRRAYWNLKLLPTEGEGSVWNLVIHQPGIFWNQKICLYLGVPGS